MSEGAYQELRVQEVELTQKIEEIRRLPWMTNAYAMKARFNNLSSLISRRRVIEKQLEALNEYQVRQDIAKSEVK